MLGFGKKKKLVIDGLDNYELPSFSASVISLLGKLRDPDCSFDQIADELEVDPGLHVRVLKTVNSVAFGLSHKVSNVQHAVSLLGRARLESLVLSVAVKSNLADEKAPTWFDMHNFWQAAARRAALARGLAQRFHPETKAECFTAGLLQDMAVPIIARAREHNYQNLYAEWNNSEETQNLVDLEQKVLQLNHARIGAEMARNWGFPANLVEMIGAHHGGEANPEIPLSVRVVSLLKENPDISIEDSAAEAERIYALDPGLYCELAQQAQVDAIELVEALR